MRITIVGDHRLLTEKPRVIKKCQCCGFSVWNKKDMTSKFRRIRKVDTKPVSHSPICKQCENVATMVLSELLFVAREQKVMPRGSFSYNALLSTIYKVNGYTTIPKDSTGEIQDVLKYQVRFCRLDGTPMVPSAVKIRQIKINAGYMSAEEKVWK